MSTLPSPPRLATRDLLAVACLVIGSLILPGLGWLAGVVLLWRSPTWRRGEKLVGTLVLPGGLLPALALPLLPAGRPLLATPGVAMAAISVLVLAPMVSAGWLLWRARARALETGSGDTGTRAG